MPKTYAEVIKQIEQLGAEAEELRLKELDGVIQRIKQDIAVYRLTAEDLGLVVGPDALSHTQTSFANGRRSTRVRFRDDTGNTWVGRGPRPQWLRDALANGKQLKDFAI